MEPDAFMRTIYLGDRGCKAILIDGWNAEIKIQINCISRIRTDTWNFYVEEDIENGRLVFTEAKLILIDPPGCIPDSFIDVVSVEKIDASLFKFVFSVGASDSLGGTVLANLTIHARQMHLEDGQGRAITE